SDGTRIFVVGGCQVAAVNAGTGARVWDRVLSPDNVDADCPYVDTNVTPLVANGTVYAGSWQVLGAFNAVTGAVTWQRDIYAFGSMALSNGVLVFSGYSSADPNQ